MDEMNAFECLVAEETQAEAGPSRPTDVAAVVRTVAAKSPQRRFRSMFSATKMAAATAVVALLGGLLVAGPLTRQSADPVPAAESEVEASRGKPAEFEGRWEYGGSMTGGGSIDAVENAWVERRDHRWTPYISEPGDPRLDGELSLVANGDVRLGVEIWHGYFRIENDEGAWQQRPMIQGVKRSGALEPMTFTAVFDGEGTYAGLMTIMGITRGSEGWDVEGMIVDAVLPPAPEIRDFYD